MNGRHDDGGMLNKQIKFCIAQTNCKHFQGGYKRL
jgi:hypothetical protein